MDASVAWLARLTDTEYRGKSWNGKSFRETLGLYSLEQVCSTETFEKFTVWSVVLHNMYWKWTLLCELGGNAPFSYEKKSFPALPEPANQEAWDKTLLESDAIHDAYLKILLDVNEADMDRLMPSWDCKVGEAIGWMATHDSYHVAQIRNMGIPKN